MRTLLQLLLASFTLAVCSIPAHAETVKIDLNSLPAYQFPPERVCLSNRSIGSLPGAGQPDGQEQDRQGGLDSGHF